MGATEEYLRAHCPAHIEIESFEFYNTNSKRYEVLLPTDFLDTNVRLFSVLAKTKKGNKEETLRIEGRAFDTSEGLFIGSRALKIEEQAKRIEGTIEVFMFPPRTMLEHYAVLYCSVCVTNALFVCICEGHHGATGLNTWDGSVVLAKVN